MEDKELVIDPETGEVIEPTDSQDIPTVASVEEDQKKALKETVEQQTEAKKIETELAKGYRVVNISPYGELHIHKPTIDDDYEADLAYSVEVSRLMDLYPNLPTMEEMEQRLERRGVWTEEHTKELEELRQDIVELSTEIFLAKAEYKTSKKASVKTKITKLTKEYEENRDQFLKMETRKSKFMSQTLEGRADERRLVVKMSRCIKRPDGSRVWETSEELKKEKDSDPVGRLVFEFMTFTQGVDPRVLEQVPDLLAQIGDVNV